MVASDVMSAIIRYLKACVKEIIKKTFLDIKETDIQWVLSIPATWIDDVRCLRKTAENVSNTDVVMSHNYNDVVRTNK